jgi:DNA-binding response OmpR family regulator
MHALPAAMLASDATEAPPCVFGGSLARNVVLQVEDNDCIARLVEHILARSGHRVLRARDGAEGAVLFAAHRDEIALVMLDCRLPDMDGSALSSDLRESRPDLPVLFTSGQHYAGPKSFTDGMTAFLAKPFLPAQLESQVNALVADIA